MAAAAAAAKAELAAAKAENEMLLQQITRLCLHIEATSGADPIEIMHGRAPPVPRPRRAASPTPSAASSSGSWFRGIFARVPGLGGGDYAAGDASTRAGGASSSMRTGSAMGEDEDGRSEASFASSMMPPPSSYAGSAIGGEAPPAETAAFVDEMPPIGEGVVAGVTFEWRGDPEAIGELERKLGQSQFVAECMLDGCGLARLPTEPAVWTHLARTLTILSLNSNGLVELPSRKPVTEGLSSGTVRGSGDWFVAGNICGWDLPAQWCGLHGAWVGRKMAKTLQ